MLVVRRLRLIALALVLSLLVASCAGGGDSPGEADGSSGNSSSSSTAAKDLPPAEIKVNPAKGTKGVMPDDEINVQVMRGTLTDVQVTGAGRAVEGEIDGQSWTSTQRLAPDTTYTVAVTADGPEGGSTTQKSTFTTHAPEVTATYGIVYDQQTVGVGMPVSIQFDSEVTDKKYRTAIEKAVSVKTTPQTEGSWGWLDNRQLMWRPKDFWAPGTTVSVDAPLTGFQTGEDKWVAEDRSGSMTAVALPSGEAALERIAHRMMVQPQWVEDRDELATAGPPKN